MGFSDRIKFKVLLHLVKFGISLEKELSCLASQAEDPEICANTVFLMTVTDSSSSLQESREEWAVFLSLNYGCLNPGAF